MKIKKIDYNSYEFLGDSNSLNIPFPLVVDMFKGCNKLTKMLLMYLK